MLGLYYIRDLGMGRWKYLLEVCRKSHGVPILRSLICCQFITAPFNSCRVPPFSTEYMT